MEGSDNRKLFSVAGEQGCVQSRAAERGEVSPEVLKQKAHSTQAEGGVRTGRARPEVYRLVAGRAVKSL